VSRPTRAPDPAVAPADSETARDTAVSADAEERHTTGLTGAPDPARDSSELAAQRDHAERDAARERAEPDGRRGRLASIDVSAVPPGMRATAAWAWRIVAIALAFYVFLIVLAKRGLAPALATAITLLSGFIGIGLLLWLVIDQFVNGFSDLSTQVNGGIDKVQDWLINGPLGLSQQQINDYVDNARSSISANRSKLTSGAIGAAGTVGEVLTGGLLTLFATIFFIKDGRQVWTWVVRLFPIGSRERVAGAGERAWRTLISYVHATVAVAFVDAVGIGIGAAILRVPLALPLAVLVFLGSFIPIVGATLTGLVAVLVALVTKGPVTALILLAVVLLVQQVEGHILQPLLLGRAVKVHPLAIVFGIATGTLLAGILGALLAVPIVAVISTVSSYLSGGSEDVVPTEPTEPASGASGGNTVPAG
jgi:predicted PurR-regulated permease PerM